MLDVNGWELIMLVVVGILVLGPERLPEYAGKLANMVRQVRNLATNARSQLKDQMGPEFEDVDWRQFDPRQYDPRRIVREALMDDPAPEPARRAREAAVRRDGSGTPAVPRPGQADPLGRRRHLTAARSVSVIVDDSRPQGSTSVHGPPGDLLVVGRRARIDRSAAGGGEAQRPSGQAARSRRESARHRRSATAAAESGSPSTTGIPESPPSRSRVSSGIWPSSGTGAPTSAGQRVGHDLAAAGRRRSPGASRPAAPATTCSRRRRRAAGGSGARSRRPARPPRPPPAAASSRRGSRRSG